MQKSLLLAGYKIGFGLLGLAALITQFSNLLQRPTFNAVNFFSFFTIESNILAVVTLLISGLWFARNKNDSALVMWRGAATLYMVITGIVYVLLLSGLEDSLLTPIPWVNTVLHYIMPLAILVDWIMDSPKKRLAFKQAAIWLAFPIAYLIYSLIRGYFVDWYPYPFLDPATQGYAGVAVTSILIALSGVALTWLLTRLPKMRT